MVKSCTSTAPIDISTKDPKMIACDDICKLYYDYKPSSCSITNKGLYLEVSTDGVDFVRFQKFSSEWLKVSSVKLFAPSLNKWDGASADAEIIITHTMSAIISAKKLHICIPIMASVNAAGSDVDWFKAFCKNIPSQRDATAAISVSNFTMNNIIPKAMFYVYVGGTFSWPTNSASCNTEDQMIIFD